MTGQSSSLNWWLEQIGRTPLLSPQQELVYGRQIQEWQSHPAGPDSCPADLRRRGLRARERFVRANLRLVVSVAKRFRRMVAAEAFDDLIQAGNQGLIEAVERYDPARGYRFSTYATYWVQMRVTCHLERAERTIRLPTTVSPKAGRLASVARRLTARLGREPTREELAAALSTTTTELDRLATVGRSCASLDCPIAVDDGPTTLGEMVAAPAPAPVDDEVLELQAQLRRLPSRSRDALAAAFGIGRGVATIAELAREQGITRAAARLRLEQALQSLRDTLNPGSHQLPLRVQLVGGDDGEPDWLLTIREQLGPSAARQKREGRPSAQLSLGIDVPRHRGSRAPTRSGKRRARTMRAARC